MYLIDEIHQAEVFRAVDAHHPQKSGATAALSCQEIATPEAGRAALFDQFQKMCRRNAGDLSAHGRKVTIRTGVNIGLAGRSKKAVHFVSVLSIMLPAKEASNIALAKHFLARG
ncbi:MAG: hypothetical protein ACK4UW_06800 [Rhizobium rhizophilum]|uniref:hypothetical protein n=1 Tax=Rhizobium rhizophilum TaxID=1850373 RepID=UPI00391A68EB